MEPTDPALHHEAPGPLEHLLLSRASLFDGAVFQAASSSSPSDDGNLARAQWNLRTDAELMLTTSPPSLESPDGDTLIALSGSLGLGGTFHIEIDGYPPYDGPIPGLQEVSMPFEAAAWSRPSAAAHLVEAPLDTAEFARVPLPAGLPGHLVLSLGDDSWFAANLDGAMPSRVEDATDTPIQTSGHVVLEAKVVVHGEADPIILAPVSISLVAPEQATMPRPAPVLYTVISTVIYLILTYGINANGPCGKLSCDYVPSLGNVTCGACSISEGGPCRSTALKCAGDPDCGALWECLEDCPADDPNTSANEFTACAAISETATCVKTHPLGLPKYARLLLCMYWQTCLCK